MIHDHSARRKREIIFLTDNYHSLGGVQRSTTTIANALHAEGHSVKIISISAAAIPMSHSLDSEIEVITCNPEISTRQKFARSRVGSKIRESVLKLFDYWKPRKLHFAPPITQGVEKLANELRAHDENSIVVVTNIVAMHYLNQALKDRISSRPKIIGQYKGDFSQMSRSNVKRLVTTYASADLLLGLTEEDAKLLSKVTQTPVDHIANPIPDAPKAYLDEPKENKFVALGRLSAEKSHASAILAWKSIADKFPDWRLVIYGEGPLRKDLENLVHKEELTDSVYLPGKTDDPSLALARAQANIVTSKHEGFGLTISGAAAVGTPTIAFNTSPGIRLQVQHEENGILVPPEDIVSLSRAIERMIYDQQFHETLRVNALRYVQKFNVDETIRRWEYFFDVVTE